MAFMVKESEKEKGGDIYIYKYVYICITESLCFTPET